MLPAVYLTCGKIAPEYENLELNVGGSTVAAAIVEATGAQRSRLREMYKDHGDLGDVAQACRHTQVGPLSFCRFMTFRSGSLYLLIMLDGAFQPHGLVVAHA